MKTAALALAVIGLAALLASCATTSAPTTAVVAPPDKAIDVSNPMYGSRHGTWVGVGNRFRGTMDLVIEAGPGGGYRATVKNVTGVPSGYDFSGEVTNLRVVGNEISFRVRNVGSQYDLTLQSDGSLIGSAIGGAGDGRYNVKLGPPAGGQAKL